MSHVHSGPISRRVASKRRPQARAGLKAVTRLLLFFYMLITSIIQTGDSDQCEYQTALFFWDLSHFRTITTGRIYLLERRLTSSLSVFLSPQHCLTKEMQMKLYKLSQRHRKTQGETTQNLSFFFTESTMRKRSSSHSDVSCPVQICKSVFPFCKSASRLVCFDPDTQSFHVFPSFIHLLTRLLF